MFRIPRRYGKCEGCGRIEWLYHWRERLYSSETGRRLITIDRWFCWYCLPTENKRN